ncbi:hypothetical protein BGZ83_003632, partial [Gryganskiella cystojenkinii]
GCHGATVIDMLCSMRNLEDFEACFIFSSDIRIDIRPRICDGLRELSLRLLVQEDITNTNNSNNTNNHIVDNHIYDDDDDNDFNVDLKEHLLILSYLLNLFQIETLNIIFNNFQQR